jgi:hypothetical protein
VVKCCVRRVACGRVALWRLRGEGVRCGDCVVKGRVVEIAW